MCMCVEMCGLHVCREICGVCMCVEKYVWCACVWRDMWCACVCGEMCGVHVCGEMCGVHVRGEMCGVHVCGEMCGVHVCGEMWCACAVGPFSVLSTLTMETTRLGMLPCSSAEPEETSLQFPSPPYHTTSLTEHYAMDGLGRRLLRWLQRSSV